MTDTTLITHFEPRALSELGVASQKLNFWLRHEPTFLPKTGRQALLAKTPLGDDKPIAMNIDLVCGLYDKAGGLIESVWYGNLRSSTNLVRHHGDRFVGMNKAYRPRIVQERLSVRLSELPDGVHEVVFFIHSHHRQALKSAIMGECGLSDDAESPIHQLAFASLDDKTIGLAVWRLTRLKHDWRMQFVMQAINAKHAGEIAKDWQDLR